MATLIRLSKWGWIDNELFLDWISNETLIHNERKTGYDATLLIIDGHSSHEFYKKIITGS